MTWDQEPDSIRADRGTDGARGPWLAECECDSTVVGDRAFRDIEECAPDANLVIGAFHEKAYRLVIVFAESAFDNPRCGAIVVY